MVEDGMKKYSEWMLGHDKSKALDINRPDPNGSQRELSALQQQMMGNEIAQAKQREKLEFVSEA